MSPVLVQNLSLRATLASLTLWRRTKTVYLWAPGIPRSRQKTLLSRVAEALVHRINPKIRIESVPSDVMVAHNWAANAEAVGEVEWLTAEIKDSWAFRTVSDIVKDEGLLKFFKAMLVADIAERRLFQAVAQDLAGRHDDLVAIPDGSEQLPGLGCTDPAGSAWNKVTGLLTLFLLPVGFLFRHLRIPTRREPVRYDVAIPVVYGVGESAFALTGVHTLRDDGALYHDELPEGRVIHVFGAVRPRPDVEEYFKRKLEDRGLPHVDWRSFHLTLPFIRLALALQGHLCRAMFSGWQWTNERVCYLRYAIRAFYWYLAYQLECEHVAASVEVVRDDYAPRHVMRTIVARQRGRKTVGIQHAAGIYDAPQLAYAHLDHYAVCAEGYVKTFLPFWRDLRLERIGRESVDWVVSLLGDSNRRQRVRERLDEKYGSRRHTVVFALALGIDPPPQAQWDEVYSALEWFIASPLDARLFLRFRRVLDLMERPHLRRLAELARRDSRLILEHEEFTTYDLMAVADLFIANSASFTIYEAIATGAKVFTFDFLGTARWFFPSYGKDFVLRTRADIVRAVSGLPAGFQGFDCRWDLIRAEGDYHYDGRNLERFRSLLVRVVRESASTGAELTALHRLSTDNRLPVNQLVESR